MEAELNFVFLYLRNFTQGYSDSGESGYQDFLIKVLYEKLWVTFLSSSLAFKIAFKNSHKLKPNFISIPKEL